MKKTTQHIACFLLVILLCCTLFPGAGASKNIVLTAVNDSFLSLSDETMPTRQNGEYYVPYSVFCGSLGLRASSQDSVLTLSSGNTTLYFNTAAGTVYDQNQKSYSSPAYPINETVYVPVRLVCGRFNFSYSTLHAGDTLILRICNSAAMRSDSEFLATANASVRALLNAYAGTPVAPKPPKPQTPPVSNDSPVTPPVVEPEELVQKPVAIGFAIVGTPNENTPTLLQALEQSEYIATFFLTIATEYDFSLLREIAVAGHRFGFLIDVEQPSSVEALQLANQQLFEATGLSTRLLFTNADATKLTAEQRDSLTGAGFRLWDGTHAISERTSKTSAELIADFSKLSNTVILALPHTATAARMITGIHPYMNENTIPLLTITTLTTPINHAYDRR